MAQEIQFTNDITGALEKTKGSSGRLNVSSRSDGRTYYASRDESEAFSVSWDDSSSAAGDFIVYWQNTDVTGRRLVIQGGVFNSENNSSMKLWTVTGTASGTTVTPVCLNFASPRSASASCVEAAGTAITGLTEDLLVGHGGVAAYVATPFDSEDAVILGQDQAIAVEYEQGTTGRTWGTLFGYYEFE